MPDVTARFLATGWTVAATLLAPALRLNLRRRVRTGREIAERLPERFGVDPTPRPPGPLLWMHAASVGETMSILPVLVALRHRVKVLLTTGTVTSQALLDQRIPEQGLTGDVLHRWSNGRFLSTPHRAFNMSSGPRYAIPYFFHPNPDTMIDCLPTCRIAGEAPRFEAMTVGDYLAWFRSRNYDHIRNAAA